MGHETHRREWEVLTCTWSGCEARFTGEVNLPLRWVKEAAAAAGWSMQDPKKPRPNEPPWKQAMEFCPEHDYLHRMF